KDSEIVKQKLQAVLSELAEQRGRYNKANGDVLKLKGDIATHKATEKSLESYTVPDTVLTDAAEADPYLRNDIALTISLKRKIQTVEDSYVNAKSEPVYGVYKADLAAAEKRVDERRSLLKKQLETKSKARQKDEWQRTLLLKEAQLAALVPQQD